MKIDRKEGIPRIRIVSHNKPLLIVIIILIALLVWIVWFLMNYQEPIGGQTDEHGCLIAAGYSYNTTLGGCVREWEDPKQVYCTEESRQGDACITLYDPVCGWSDPEKVQCLKYPCASTYSNSCFACLDEDVEYWTAGECPTG